MANETVILKIRELADEMLAPYPEYFVVDVRIKPTNNVKLYVDGDNGVPVEKLVAFNRNMYPRLESAALFPDNDFSLEVSSPGLDEPLKLHRQYLKNIGRKVAVTHVDGSEKEGTLLAATEEKITIEETVGKKKEKKTTDINLNEIKHTKVCIVF
jgi:ribosome maturation factor RimP